MIGNILFASMFVLAIYCALRWHCAQSDVQGWKTDLKFVHGEMLEFRKRAAEEFDLRLEWEKTYRDTHRRLEESENARRELIISIWGAPIERDERDVVALIRDLQQQANLPSPLRRNG